MNSAVESSLHLFFDNYTSLFNKNISDSSHAGETAQAFASCFVGANPYGVYCAQNNEAFIDTMRKGYDFYRAIGITSMAIEGLEITVLDDFHALVKVHWKSNYTLKDKTKGEMLFDVIYLLQNISGKYKIFAYISGDEQKALVEKGLVNENLKPD